MQTEIKYDGNGQPFKVPIQYESLERGHRKIRKKATNITPKKKKRK